MKSTVSSELTSMKGSLKKHIELAKELNMNLAAKLLRMALLEIEMNLHDISEQELDALCAYAEDIDFSEVAKKQLLS